MRKAVLNVLGAMCMIVGVALITELAANRQLSATPMPGCAFRIPSDTPQSCNSNSYVLCSSQPNAATCAIYASDGQNPAGSNFAIVYLDNGGKIPLDCTQVTTDRKQCDIGTMKCYRYTYCVWNPDVTPPACQNDPNLQGTIVNKDQYIAVPCP